MSSLETEQRPQTEGMAHILMLTGNHVAHAQSLAHSSTNHEKVGTLIPNN